MPGLAVRSKVRILLDVINNIESGKAAAMPWAFSHQNMAVASAFTRARHTDVPPSTCASLRHVKIQWLQASCLESYFGIICHETAFIIHNSMVAEMIMDKCIENLTGSPSSVEGAKAANSSCRGSSRTPDVSGD